MKFKNRDEARVVNETMASLLCPLRNHCDKRTQECIQITLRILSETGIEEMESKDKE